MGGCHLRTDRTRGALCESDPDSSLVEGKQPMFPLILMTIENDEDRALMEELYLQYHRLMYVQALRILNNNYAAEDAVSDAIEALIYKISLLRNMDSNKRKAYIVITVRHMAINHYRRHSRETVMKGDFLEEIPSGRLVDDHVMEDAGIKEIKEAVCQLNVNDREILMMRYFREMSDTEISRELGVLPTTARVRISRARKHLINLLEGKKAEL